MWFLFIIINGVAMALKREQPHVVHMRKFKDGETVYIEPFRAKAFPVIKDLIVDVLHLTEFNKLVHTYQLTLPETL